MFGIGPPEMVVLAIVAVVVIGPDKLPGLARDAARMLRTLRDLATGARQQLRDELGPEFADVDLRNLNPRTALTRAVFGDEEELESLRRLDPRRWDAKSAARNFVSVDDDPGSDERVSFDKRDQPSTNGTGLGVNGSASHGSVNGSTNAAARPRPRPRPGPGAAPGAGSGAGPSAPYDADAT